jgi:hypothetical protein
MFTDRGIGSDSWVYVDDTCALSIEPERSQVRFEFGHDTTTLNLCVSAAMMPVFAQAVQDALARLRKCQRDGTVGEDVSYDEQ